MADFKDVKLTSEGDKTVLGLNHDVERLDDYHEAEFKGATLSLSEVNNQPVTPVSEAVVSGEPGTLGPTSDPNQEDNRNSNEQKPAATAAAAPNHRTSSFRGMSAEEIREFFAVRQNGALENAAEQCRPVMLENLDGELRGTWLLTEIDHWDTEKERIIFLTDYSLLVLKYDFITLRLLDYKRLHLKEFDNIIIGELKYPEKSLMPPRNQIGVRCMWNQGQPLPFMKNWNPWSRDIPWVTYTSHPLVKQDGSPRSSYDIEDFAQKLAQTVENLDLTKAPPHDMLTPLKTCDIEYQPVLIENYAGVVAAFHNANDFGFFKSRGKVSF